MNTPNEEKLSEFRRLRDIIQSMRARLLEVWRESDEVVMMLEKDSYATKEERQ